MYHHIKHVKDEHRKAKSPRTSREEPRSPSKRICSSSSAGVLPSQKHTHPDESVVQNHLVTEKSANNDVRKENIGIARAAPFSLSNQIRSQMEPYERQQQVLKADDSIEDLVLLLDGDAHIMSPKKIASFYQAFLMALKTIRSVKDVALMALDRQDLPCADHLAYLSFISSQQLKLYELCLSNGAVSPQKLLASAVLAEATVAMAASLSEQVGPDTRRFLQLLQEVHRPTIGLKQGQSQSSL